ncbi:LTA synthase family protein [Streptococcaceae bacterium ESL0729]|nr:LTA synthase family protein [Streptococcaceae bacterium ESL0729]
MSLAMGLYALVNDRLFTSVDIDIDNVARSVVGTFTLLLPLSIAIFSLLILWGKNTRGATFFKAAILYLFTRIFHFLIVLTKNVNDEDFRLDFKNLVDIFIDWKLLSYLGVLLALFFLFSRLKRFRAFVHESPLSDLLNIREGQILTALFTLFIYLSPEVFSLLEAKFYYLSPSNSIDLVAISQLDLFNFLSLNLRELAIFMVILLVAAVFVDGLKGFFSNQTSWQLALISSLFLAVNSNYLIQLSLANYTKIAGYFVLDGASLFQILTLFLLYGLSYALTNRYFYGTFLNLTLTSLLVFSNIEKFSLRGEPVYLSDFAWLKNFRSLVDFIDITKVIWMGLVLLILLLATFFLQRKFLRGGIYRSYKKRIMLIISLVFSLWLIGDNTAKNPHIKIPVLADFTRWQDGNILWQGNTPTANMKSLAFVWYMQLFNDAMDEPAGYSQKKVMEIRDKYIKRAKQINQNRKDEIGDKTVIFVLSESLANPNRLPQIKLSKNPLTEIDQIKEKTASGLMISHGYGGGTANMEFEGLTGLSLDYFNPSVTVINNEVVPKMAFIPALSDFFKNKTAIHLENAENYNRRNIYQEMGYEEFISLGNSNMLALDVENYGVHPSDASSYGQVIDSLTMDAQFFSLITMQNHSPWVNVGGDISAEFPKLGKGVNENLANYANALAQTDIETKKFLDKLSLVTKDISVVFYGDHLPGFYPQSVFDKNPKLKYQTDYFIWNNKKDYSQGQPIVRTSDFIPELLELVDAKVSPWYALQTDHYKEVPNKQMLGNDGELTASQKEISDDFKIIQYDLTLGKHYLKADDSFFKEQ